MEDRGESCLEGSSGIPEGGSSLALPSLLQPGPAHCRELLVPPRPPPPLFSPSLPHLPSPSSTSLSPLALSVSVLLPPLVPFSDRVFHCPKAYQDFPHLSFLGTDLFDLGYLVVLKSEPRVTPSKDSVAKQHPNLVRPCILNSHPPTHLASFLTWWFW